VVIFSAWHSLSALVADMKGVLPVKMPVSTFVKSSVLGPSHAWSNSSKEIETECIPVCL